MLQSKHDRDPSVEACLPASHGKQVEAPVRFMKRPELQLPQFLAAVPEIFPAEHSPQLLAP